MLTLERLKELLRYNSCTGEFYWRETGVARPAIQAGKQAGWRKTDGYIQIGIDRKTYYAHVLAWLYTHGDWPQEIDHLDNDKSNNRVLNLLNVNHSDNLRRYYQTSRGQIDRKYRRSPWRRSKRS
jgi:hypothetical protein